MPKIKVIKNILDANRNRAKQNQNFFRKNGILAINLMGSPGSGKTSIVEQVLKQKPEGLRFAVIEGDLATSRDAERIASFGIPVVQVNTQGGCHLDSAMIRKAVEVLKLEDINVLLIENVGNLVCPADFDLGESLRVVVLSIPEGEDKIEKYPFMFRFADCCIINKTDLSSSCDVSEKTLHKIAHKVNKDLDIFHVSCKTGKGISEWADWLRSKQEGLIKA